MKVKLAHASHWIGFLLTLTGLLLAYLDQSQDEIAIHLTASLVPLFGGWGLACVLTGPRNILPFLVQENHE